MKYESKKIASYKNEDIFSVSLINDNNFKINFYNFGGHIHQINIPYHNNIDKYEEHRIRKLTELLHLSHTDFIKSKLK